MQSQVALLRHLPLLVVISFIAYEGVRGTYDVVGYDDFEVFHTAGKLTVQRSDQLYESRTEVKGRTFLYPPSAGLVFAPLGVLSYKSAGVVYSVLKVGALAALLGVALGFSISGAPRALTPAIMALLLIFAAFRPIDNDFGNGQINIFIALLSAGGACLMMKERRLWIWAGALMLAIAAAIKLTPLLLLAMPLLHRRFESLIASLVLFFILAIGAPIVWFGPAKAAELNSQFAGVTTRLSGEPNPGDEISFHQLVIYMASQIKADPDLLYNDAELYRVENGKETLVQLPPPFGPLANRLIWLAEGAAVGLCFLGVRFRLFRGRRPDWTWDLAMLCALVLLLAPFVRKAHLVWTLIPLGWIVCRLDGFIARAGGWGAAWRSHRGVFVALITLVALLYASDDVPLPIHASFPAPSHPAPFFALLFLCGLLIKIQAIENREPATED